MSILMIVTVKFCLHIRVQRHYRKASRDGRGAIKSLKKQHMIKYAIVDLKQNSLPYNLHI